MGGPNAMAFAAWHPDRVSRLVIVDSRPTIPSERLDRMHARGRRAPRLHPDPDSAARAFRLLPRETVAAPELLTHLARAGFVARGRGWVYRLDPACHGPRAPVGPRHSPPRPVSQGTDSDWALLKIRLRRRASVVEEGSADPRTPPRARARRGRRRLCTRGSSTMGRTRSSSGSSPPTPRASRTGRTRRPDGRPR